MPFIDSFAYNSFRITHTLLNQAIPEDVLYNIVFNAINFDVPLVSINNQIQVLELFHGPSMAFKDFGARFLAGLMSYFLSTADKETTILVATSGDTGGAVASAFYNKPGINVIILYPSGKVSDLQEKQLTTYGNNIRAVEILGNFDDCQRLVREAFVDKSLRRSFRFSSANSINIARLIPQSFYYFEGYRLLRNKMKVTFSVPCGNLGNLCAGLLAKKMGLPVFKFIAATNINNVFPMFLETGAYSPMDAVQTISNAMDVGDPSNLSRLMALYDLDLNRMKKDLSGYYFDDKQAQNEIKRIYERHSYLFDPHGIIAYLAASIHKSKNIGCQYIVLETAHPAKFIPVLSFQI